MNFIEAINLLNTHTVKAVRKSSWKRFQYIFHDPDSGFLTVILEMNLDNQISLTLPYTPPIDEILANDWEIYEEKTKLHTFEKALSALKEGKTIKRKLWTTKVIERDFCDDYSIMFTIDDFEAKDWEILYE